MREIVLGGTAYKLADGSRIIKRQLNPFKAKLGAQGGLEFSDFSEASMEEYHDFRGGIGLESELPTESNRIQWSQGIDLSTPRSAVLGPKINTADYDTWEGSYDYALLNFVIPITPNGYCYECTTDSGSSGSGQPTWPTVLGNTVADGGITWTCRAYLASVDIIDFDGSTYVIQNSRILKWDDTNLDCVKNDFASPLHNNALVIQDNTAEYFIISSSSAVIYSTDGSNWSTLTNAIGGYMASFAGRLWFISTDGKTVQYSALNDIDDFSDNWTSPIGFSDPGGDWDNEASAYDELTVEEDSSSYATGNVNQRTLFLTVPSGRYDRIRYYCDISGGSGDRTVAVKAFYKGAWATVFEGALVENEWVTKTLSVFETITTIGIYLARADATTYKIYEVDIGTQQQFELSGDFGTVYGLFEGKLLSDGSPALYFHGNRGLFVVDVNNQKAYQQEIEYPPLTNAGRAGMYWNANLWVATGYGIKKISPSTAVPIGPNEDDGLPNGSQGIIYDMVTVNNWLVYCVNGGSTDRSSILKRNATLGGNLQVYTSATGKPIACLHHSPSSKYTNGRLWWGEGTDVKYCMFPDVTHNVKAVSGYEYVAASTANHLQLPIFRKLAAISKVALGVAAITKSLDNTEKLTVYYGLNGDAPTQSLGEFITSPRPTLLKFNSGLGTEFYRIQLAVKFERDSGDDSKSPELESLLFYYYSVTVPIHSWTFLIDATGVDGEKTFTNLETIRDTKLLVPFYDSGNQDVTSYNVKLFSMPSREFWENQGQREGIIEVVVKEVFGG